VSFDRAFEKLLGVEGGYVNDPRDSGGATRYGITEAVARANGYQGVMVDLPLEWARRIYKAQYWDTLRLDDISIIEGTIAEELFDTSVNMGVSTAGRFLQRSLNALNRGGTDYQDLAVDGVIGPMSVSCLSRYLQHRSGADGITVMLRALNILQGARYIELAESRQKDEAFLYGWLKTRVVI